MASEGGYHYFVGSHSFWAFLGSVGLVRYRRAGEVRRARDADDCHPHD